MSPNTKKLVGALVAGVLAIAVFYGLIGQKQATSIQNQANQTLGTGPASQQVAPPTSSNATNAQPATSPQNTTAAPTSGVPQNTSPSTAR